MEELWNWPQAITTATSIVVIVCADYALGGFDDVIQPALTVIPAKAGICSSILRDKKFCVGVNSGVKVYQPDARLPVLLRHGGVTWIIWRIGKINALFF